MGFSGARAIIEHEGKLLAVKHAGSDFYCLPGGRAESGESILEVLEREMIEELNVRPVIGNLLYVQQMANFQNNGTRYGEPSFIFHVLNGADYHKADFSKASHSHELAVVQFVNPADVIFKPKEIADDWDNLLKSRFNLPTKMLIGEWKP